MYVGQKYTPLIYLGLSGVFDSPLFSLCLSSFVLFLCLFEYKQINLILLFTSAVDVAYLASQAQVIGWTYAPTVNNMGFAFSAINIVVKVCVNFLFA